MRILTLIAGILCLFVVLLDAFQTIILPRRATGPFPAHAHLLHRYLEALGLLDPAAPQSAQTRDRVQLLRPLVADFSAGGVGRLAWWWALRSSSMRWAARSTMPCRSRLSIGPLRERNHHLHAGPGRRDAAAPGPRELVILEAGTGLRLSGRRHGLFSGALRRVFAARGEHLAAGCARRIAAYRRRTDAPPFLRARSRRSRCC